MRGGGNRQRADPGDVRAVLRCAVRELTLILGGVEVAEGFSNEAVGSGEAPELEAGDADAMAGAAGAGVGAGEGPVVFEEAIGAGNEAIAGDDHVGESGHEGASGLGDGGAADCRCALIDREGPVRGEVCGDEGGVLTAPSGGIVGREVVQGIHRRVRIRGHDRDGHLPRDYPSLLAPAKDLGMLYQGRAARGRAKGGNRAGFEQIFSRLLAMG